MSNSINKEKKVKEDTKDTNEDLLSASKNSIDPNNKIQSIGDQVRIAGLKTINDVFIVLFSGVVIYMLNTYYESHSVKPISLGDMEYITLTGRCDDTANINKLSEIEKKRIERSITKIDPEVYYHEKFIKDYDKKFCDDDTFFGPIVYIIRALYLNCYNQSHLIIYTLSYWSYLTPSDAEVDGADVKKEVDIAVKSAFPTKGGSMIKTRTSLEVAAERAEERTKQITLAAKKKIENAIAIGAETTGNAADKITKALDSVGKSQAIDSLGNIPRKGIRSITILFLFLFFYFLSLVFNNSIISMLKPFFPGMASSILVNIIMSICGVLLVIYSVCLFFNSFYYVYLLVSGLFRTNVGEVSSKISLWYAIFIILTAGSAISMGSNMANSSSSSSCKNSSNAGSSGIVSILLLIPIIASFFPLFEFIKGTFSMKTKQNKEQVAANAGILMVIIFWGIIMIIILFTIRFICIGYGVAFPNNNPIIIL